MNKDVVITFIICVTVCIYVSFFTLDSSTGINEQQYREASLQYLEDIRNSNDYIIQLLSQ